MRRLFGSAVLLLMLGLVCSPVSPADDPPKVPNSATEAAKAADAKHNAALNQPAIPGIDSIKLSVTAGKRISVLTAETKGTLVRWLCVAPNRSEVDLIPIGDSKVAHFAAPTGVYTVYAWSAVDGLPTPAAIVTVTVGEPVPGPGPGPTPTPDESFAKAVQDAYTADASPLKARYKSDLAALYRSAVKDTIPSMALGTIADVLKIMVDSRKELMPDDAILGVRKVIETQLNKLLPTKPDTKLDATTRTTIGNAFTAVAAALEGAK